MARFTTIIGRYLSRGRGRFGSQPHIACDSVFKFWFQKSSINNRNTYFVTDVPVCASSGRVNRGFDIRSGESDTRPFGVGLVVREEDAVGCSLFAIALGLPFASTLGRLVGRCSGSSATSVADLFRELSLSLVFLTVEFTTFGL